MFKRNLIFLPLLSLCLCSFLTGFSLNSYTYFTYEIDPQLKDFTTEPIEGSLKQVIKWDKIGRRLQKTFPNERNVTFLAYLSVAQSDAANLSSSLGQKVPSLDPVSYQVIKLFFPDYQAVEYQTDAYSEFIANLVMDKLKIRFEEEQKNQKPYIIKRGDGFWAIDGEPEGLTFGNCKCWFVKDLEAIKAPIPPPHRNLLFWDNQLGYICGLRKCLTPEQNQAILFWANQLGPESGDWSIIGLKYLYAKNFNLTKTLWIRSILFQTISDANTAMFDSKYTYFVKRPFMLDPHLKSPIKCPDHPSYPSGHSTISGCMSTVLTYFFPEAKERWHWLALQSGNSRIWAGIHYPIDNDEGYLLGQRVGKVAIETLQKK